MIHADKRVAQYDTEFARLTLASLSKDLTSRRRSTVTGSRPSIMQDTQIEQRLQSLPEAENDNSKQEYSGHIKASRTSSQETLVDVSLTEPSKNYESRDIGMTDVDAHSPTLGTLDEEPTDKHMETESTLITVNGDDGDESTSSTNRTIDLANPPPTRTAPKPDLPPRPSKDNQKDSQISAVEDTAKQQDAAEVADNIVSKLRTAIKPTGFDSGGEQNDQIRE